MKQRNEGGWDFFWDEESRPGVVVLDVHVARHLDSSLIDVDIHPHFISIVIKSKVLRLRLPAEVKVSESKCQRSKVSGSLMVIMPKVNARENDLKAKAAAGGAAPTPNQSQTGPLTQDRQSRPTAAIKGRAPTAAVSRPKKLSLQEQIIQDALDAAAAAAPAESNSSSNTLLDKDFGNKGQATRATSGASENVDVRNIIRQKPAAESASGDLFELETVFSTSNRVTELD